jgi:uncharacterized protein YaaR (DUF327 family)
MALAKRDMCIQRMESELINRQNFMNSKGDEIVSNATINPLLKKVLKEYVDYYDEETSILRHKQDGMSKILHYLDKIIDEGGLSKEDLAKTQDHYNRILNKFEEVDNKMQSLISN